MNYQKQPCAWVPQKVPKASLCFHNTLIINTFKNYTLAMGWKIPDKSTAITAQIPDNSRQFPVKP
jgi:hypothetical protein